MDLKVCFCCGQALGAISNMFLLMQARWLWNVSILHFVPAVPLKKQSVVLPHVMSTQRGQRVEAELQVSDVLSSVVQRLCNETEPWSKLENQSFAGHFYRAGSGQKSKSIAPPHTERLTRGWFIHISVALWSESNGKCSHPGRRDKGGKRTTIRASWQGLSCLLTHISVNYRRSLSHTALLLTVKPPPP